MSTQEAATRPAKDRIRTSVSLAPEIVEYLDNIARQADRDRSWVVTAIVRQHAELMRLKHQAPRVDDPSEAVITV